MFKYSNIHMAPSLLVCSNRYFKCSWNWDLGAELDFSLHSNSVLRREFTNRKRGYVEDKVAKIHFI